MAELSKMTEEKINKAQRALLNAFLEMRAQMPLEKISVTALCDKADVNKSTFYAYYHDVYDLSRQLQKEVIDRIASTLPLKEAKHEPGVFAKEVLMSYEANKTMIQTLFSGPQRADLPELIKEKVMTYYEDNDTDYTDEQLKLIITYKTYGAYFAFIEESDMNEMDKINFIARISG